MSKRTYHDPLHGGITLDSSCPAEAMVMRLIDSEPFQRLRRIRQLGPAFLTFHGAESSRFTHSIGVFYLARKALKRLTDYDKSLKECKGLLYAASLLHDLGHGPLSHTGEEMFGLSHEFWSAKVIREHPSIRDPIETYASGASQAVADLLENGLAKSSAIKSLVSSQLDCDRLDYLLRDSHSTGAKYGLLDLDRILSAITIAPDGGLAIHPKGLMAVEHYLIVRNLMYRSVYNHRINEVCSWLLEQLIRTARVMGPKEVWADKIMKKWLWGIESLDLYSFLGNDDIRVGYHFLQWEENAPEPLARLCKRFLNRHLLKALPVDHFSREEQLEALAIARKLVEGTGENPDFCCGLRTQNLHGYHPYKGGLRLWDGNQLKAIEQASPLVSSLTRPADSSWLIHPKEIHSQLRNKLKDLSLKAL